MLLLMMAEAERGGVDRLANAILTSGADELMTAGCRNR
jgi:hypothetical protein